MLVTVYITTYNRKDLLKRAIDSVLAQTYQPIEIIVADDGSSDGSQAYLLALEEQGVVKGVLNTTGKSKGACYGRNKAIELASGEFITGLDDDDYFEPWRVQSFLDKWQQYTKQGESFSALFDSVVEHRKYAIVECYDTPKVTHKMLRSANIVGNQVFTLAENFRRIGGFDEAMPALQDWDTWLRLSQQFGDVLNINTRSYVQFHDHGGARISEKPGTKIRFAFERLMSKLAPLTSKEEASFLHAMYSYHQIDNRQNELFKLLLAGHFRRVAQVLKRMLLKAIKK